MSAAAVVKEIKQELKTLKTAPDRLYLTKVMVLDIDTVEILVKEIVSLKKKLKQSREARIPR